MSWFFNSLKIIYSLGSSCYKTGEGFWNTKSIKLICTKQVDLWKLGIILPYQYPLDVYFRHTGKFNRLWATIIPNSPTKLQWFCTCLSVLPLPLPGRVYLAAGASVLLHTASSIWKEYKWVIFLNPNLNECIQNISILLIICRLHGA